MLSDSLHIDDADRKALPRRRNQTVCVVTMLLDSVSRDDEGLTEADVV